MPEAPQDDNGPRYPVAAADRVLRLLLMFRERSAVRIVDAARELDVSPSTVHRLLAMLMAHGFVARDTDTQAYVPGEVVVDLAVQVINQLDFVDVARPFLADLVMRTGETVTMGVLRRREVLYVLEIESDQVVRVGNQLGRRVPGFQSAIGRVLLAELAPARVRELYPDSELHSPANDVVVGRGQLEADLEMARQRGYAVSDQPRSLGFSSVAVPLRRHGHAVAGISVAAPQSRVNEGWPERALAELSTSVKAIEAVLK